MEALKKIKQIRAYSAAVYTRVELILHQPLLNKNKRLPFFDERWRFAAKQYLLKKAFWFFLKKEQTISQTLIKVECLC